MNNYNKNYSEIINLMFLIKHIYISCWNIYYIDIVFPEEIKNLIFIIHLNVIKQSIDPKYRTRHCYDKNWCHNICTVIQVGNIGLIVSGDFCITCGKGYCKECKKGWIRNWYCNFCK